jgi:hypothetical protein
MSKYHTQCEFCRNFSKDEFGCMECGVITND